MPRLFIGIFLLACLVGCSGSTVSNDPVSRATNATDQYQFLMADSLFTELVKQDTISASVPYLAGVNKERQLLLWDALQYYLVALTRDVKYAPAYGGLHRVFARLNSPILAADAARTYAELSGTDVDAWTTSAHAYIEAGQFGEAQRAIGQAEAAGLPADAIALLKARMEFQRHDYTTAEQSSAVAVSSPAGRKALANYLATRGYCDSAAAISRELFESEKSHDALLDYFFMAMRTGHLYDARKAVAEMRKRDKSDILPRAAMVFYYDQSGEYVSGRDAATKLNEVQPLAISTYAYLYQLASRTSNTAVAGGAAEELMANIDQRRFHPIVKQYAIYKRIMPRARSMASPQVVVTLDSITMIPMRSEVDFQAWYAFALESVRKFNNVGDTLPTFERFTEAWSGHPSLWTAFAATRMGFSPITTIKAETLLTTVLTRDGHFKPAFDSLWVVYHFVGEFGKAAELFNKYPQYLQYYPTAGLQQAISLAEVGRIDEATAAAERVLPMAGGNRILLEQVTRSMVRHGGAAKALALVEKVLAADPKNADLHVLAARLACDNGDCKRGLEYADKGLQLEPGYRSLATERGRILFDSGEEDAGIKALTEQVSGDLTNADALIYLSRRLAKLHGDVARAQDIGRQAVNAAPMALRASINLAYVYLATERYDLARGAADMALKNYPNDPEAYYLLGKAMFNEKKPEAKEQLQKAVTLGLTGDGLTDAQAMLQRM
ncbi:MAG: hypothetical protein IPH75_10445 [bacterium]|nr:hypothetical protein [bacterium]